MKHLAPEILEKVQQLSEVLASDENTQLDTMLDRAHQQGKEVLFLIEKL